MPLVAFQRKGSAVSVSGDEKRYEANFPTTWIRLRLPFHHIKELSTIWKIALRSECDSCNECDGLTSASALLTISELCSGSSPGFKEIPKCARTALLGGGINELVMNLIALMPIDCAAYSRIANDMATIWTPTSQRWNRAISIRLTLLRQERVDPKDA